MWKKSQNWMGRFSAVFVLALMACSAIYGQDVVTNYLPGRV